ncbi:MULTISPECIES: DUF4190 domain-containing protein [unclassified Microbacterium]|uniref:DUF4190 domain-containing protein n=1 Tax=unclassified Microbacterium TaxID=2609290 RepID=UPI002883205E|nr:MULTISPECIES: DUF4190 domain-containing protein [unclassified Microbacterium]
MGLFQHEITSISDAPRPRVSRTAVVALISAACGFLTAIGFVIAIVLGHLALIRMYFQRSNGTPKRGRRLAIAALWISYTALTIAAAALLTILLIAYAELPAPPSIF